MSLSSPYHNFKLPVGEPPVRFVSLELAIELLLRRHPAFLRWKNLYRNARKEWTSQSKSLSTENMEMESKTFDEDDTVSISDDYDSCQKPTYSSESNVSDCDLITVEVPVLERNQSNDKILSSMNLNQKMPKHDYSKLSPHRWLNIIYCNPFGLIAGVIARNTQGNWHPTLRYSVDEILQMLEYDPVTCWSTEQRMKDDNNDDDEDSIQFRKLDKARTCRILSRLFERSIRLHDLACWLPPIDQTDELASSFDTLNTYHSYRQRSQHRARRFFHSLPALKMKRSNIFYINIEPNNEKWKGAYRLTIEDSDNNYIKWKIVMSDSFLSSAKESEEDDAYYHHPLAPFLYRWTTFNKNYYKNKDDKDDQQTKEKRVEYIDFIRQVQRLHVGPTPHVSFIKTLEWLETTNSLEGCVRKNEWTMTLFHWLSIPSEEIDKDRNRNRNTFCASAQIRSMGILSLLFLDIHAIESFKKRAAVRRQTFTYDISKPLSDIQAKVCRDRNYIWFGTLALFLDAGVPLHALRVRIPIDSSDMACKFLYDPSFLCNRNKSNKNKKIDQESKRQALELTVREWCALNIPNRQVYFIISPSKELEVLSPFNKIHGWTTQDYIKAMQIENDIQSRYDLSDYSSSSDNKNKNNEIDCAQTIKSSSNKNVGVDMMMTTNARLHHYRPIRQARTFCYYDLCVWPPLYDDAVINSRDASSVLFSDSDDIHSLIEVIEKEKWNPDRDLHPLTLIRPDYFPTNAYSSKDVRTKSSGILYWNKLVQTALHWLAKDQDDFNNQVGDCEYSCAIYRQVIIRALSLMND